MSEPRVFNGLNWTQGISWLCLFRFVSENQAVLMQGWKTWIFLILWMKLNLFYWQGKTSTARTWNLWFLNMLRNMIWLSLTSKLPVLSCFQWTTHSNVHHILLSGHNNCFSLKKAIVRSGQIWRNYYFKKNMMTLLTTWE